MRKRCRRAAGMVLAAGMAGIAASGGAQQLDPADLQRLMESAQGLQTCLAGIDPNALDALRSRGEAIAAELKAMCAAGQRDAAQARAVEYGREVAASPLLDSLGDCGEQVKSMMRIPYVADTMEGKTQHVCDAGL